MVKATNVLENLKSLDAYLKKQKTVFDSRYNTVAQRLENIDDKGPDQDVQIVFGNILNKLD